MHSKSYVALIIEHRNYLGYFGVPIYEKTSIVGDNVAMIYDARLLFSKLLKRHPILTYHSVRTITACNGEYKLSQMEMFSAGYIQSNEQGAIQAPTNMNLDELCIYSNIILFIITRIYSLRFKQFYILLTIVVSKRGVTEF